MIRLKNERALLCGVANPTLTWSLRISWPSQWMVNWLVKRTSSKHSFIGVSKTVESYSLCKSKRIKLTRNVTCGSQSPKSMSAISQELISNYFWLSKLSNIKLSCSLDTKVHISKGTNKKSTHKEINLDLYASMCAKHLRHM